MNIQSIISELHELGVLQSTIASVGGVSQATISRLKTGEQSDTSYTTASKLQQFLLTEKEGASD